MGLLYSLGVWLYTATVYVASVWNAKAKRWVSGRREAKAQLTAFFSRRNASPNANRKLYWFHCASLGEFEQGRPLIEELKATEDCLIAVSFFSPSGFEIRKNYDLADIVFYLPVDSKKNAVFVFGMLKPTSVFFVKYEFWARYIFEAKSRNIPCYSVAAIFRKDQLFFKWYGTYMCKVLRAFDMIFVQNEASADLLKSIRIDAVVAGDTRYDRVLKNAESAKKFDLIDQFVEGHKVFVCGSLWKPDLETISTPLNALGRSWKIIVTTHEIDDHHLNQAIHYFGKDQVVKYSQLNSITIDKRVVLIDNIGMLMHLYGYADLAYVGGAFKTGLHNILEPAAFGVPVIFGPNYQKFPEAQLFINNGVGFSVSDEHSFGEMVSKLVNADLCDQVSAFMTSKKGATRLILDNIR